ncbi:MAG: acyltransferase family protein [Actinomycetota bacterium]
MTLPPPPRPDTPRLDLTPASPRRYDLDALRGVAMLLGIVLHAAIPFVPYWEEGDTGGSFLFALFEYIHLWRMPLFFLLSGFFTAMLWHRRGLRALLDHRARRIGLPLAIFYVPIIILVILSFVFGYLIAGLDVEESERDGTADYSDPNETDDVGDTDDEDDDEGAPFSWAHMWFLWHLLWLVGLFAAVARSIDRIGARAPPPTVLAIAAWSLPFLSLIPFSFMAEDVLGPDTSETLIPAFHVLAFYACFFFFGALVFRTGDEPGPIDRLGRWWAPQLAASIVVFVLLLGQEFPDRLREPSEVLLAWMVSFAGIGLFRTRFADPSFRVRWLSDAAYWMYLLHLPIVVFLQGVMAALGVPALAGFVLIVAITVAVLVPSYRYLVRYTPVGTLLNGERTKDGDVRLRAVIDLTRSGP